MEPITPLLSGVGESSRRPSRNPNAPSPTASTGAVTPRAGGQRPRSQISPNDCYRLAKPVGQEATQFLWCRRRARPIITSLPPTFVLCSRRTSGGIPSTHVHVVGVGQRSALVNARVRPLPWRGLTG